MTSRSAYRYSPIGTSCQNVKTVAFIALLAALSSNAVADDADFAKSEKCMTRHAIAEKLVGPSFRSVATRHANDKDAEVRLAKRRSAKAGRARGGAVPMPKNPDVDAAQVQRLAHWVLMQT